MDLDLQRQLFQRYPLFFRKPGYRLSFNPPLISNLISDEIVGDYVIQTPAGNEGGPPFRISDWSPIDAHGIQCGDGWATIVEGVAAAFELEIREMMITGRNSNDWPRAAQLREKLGTLRISATGLVSPQLRESIEDAEDQSANTCKTCGETGFLHNREGVMVCLCYECIAEENKSPYRFDFQRFLAKSQGISDLLMQREPAA